MTIKDLDLGTDSGGPTTAKSNVVLVVDDDEDVRHSLELVLASHYRVVSAASADEGVRAVDDSTAVVVLDIKMQGKDGFQAYKEIKQKSPDTLIIFYTGYQDVRDPYDVLNEFRPFGYVRKGGAVRELFDTVASAVSHFERVVENRQLVRQLRDVNNQLENMVEERTRALEDALERIQRLAVTDPLTGIPNRRLFFDQFQKELARTSRYGRPIGVLLADLDHFKTINDNYGHPVGDIVLRNVAQVLQASVRASDTVGRVGGEEFAVLLPETPLELTRLCAERLRRLVEEEAGQIPNSATPLHVTISIGGCVLDGQTQLSHEDVLAAADRLLYEAKAAGRNRIQVIALEPNAT